MPRHVTQKFGRQKYTQKPGNQLLRGKKVIPPLGLTWNDLDRVAPSSGETNNHKESGASNNIDADFDDTEWEDGSYAELDRAKNGPANDSRNITIEFGECPGPSKGKCIRQIATEDKKVSKTVHKVHLLCLLARGCLIDDACDDPLIQASVLSLLPGYLLKISSVSNLRARVLSPLVSWFHQNFHVNSQVSKRRSFHESLAHALANRAGTSEEIAALSVSLFRALGFTTRFVSVLDVSALRPKADRIESNCSSSNVCRSIFNSPTVVVDRPARVIESPFKSSSCNKKDSEQDDCDTKTFPSSVRKGDLEFEMQLHMALSATAVPAPKNATDSNPTSSCEQSDVAANKGAPNGVSTALGSKRTGPLLHWAEVYCSGECLSGKWVHIDSANAIIDHESKVEAAAAACRMPLRYVVAFAGHGAKDVTRRYCTQWHKIASQRVDQAWWDAVMEPLRNLESGATSEPMTLANNENGARHNEYHHGSLNEVGRSVDGSASAKDEFIASRNTLEDMELETRALTEPLPTNQQAYRNHQLYALERWLTKFQVLHPKGPILGYCSGHPVYPRACVQTVKTKQRWLREGLQVKKDQIPAKVLKQGPKSVKVQPFEDEEEGAVFGEDVELYGRWQLEELQLPHAVNGIVPKNEHGQVEVWSEKCLPPGTVHLKRPRISMVTKRLEIDYAPAMVGFEFKNGRSHPIFDGIVVCSEFKDAILEAFAEEEERRADEDKGRREKQALSRWYQLLSSIITRQKLNNRYGNPSSPHIPSSKHCSTGNAQHIAQGEDGKPLPKRRRAHGKQEKNIGSVQMEDHQHEFVAESTEREGSVTMRRCRCGFAVQVEEL